MPSTQLSDEMECHFYRGSRGFHGNRFTFDLKEIEQSRGFEPGERKKALRSFINKICLIYLKLMMKKISTP